MIHTTLADGRWNTFSFYDQMANVGTDVARALSWRKRGDNQQTEGSLQRALELLDLTFQDPKNKPRRKELARVKEVLLDTFYGENEYGSSDELWEKYFEYFALASAWARGR